MLNAVKRSKRVYIIGNGGSYANAQHICNDLLNSGIRAYTLDSATLTAFANDHGYEFVFSKWLVIVGEPGDLLIALSGSGKSKNILNAIESAKTIGMDVKTIFGCDRNQGMQEAEEYQLVVGHHLMQELK